MSATPDSTLANLERLIADLQRQLAECRAERDVAQRQLAERTIERDEALAQQTATAEVLGVINSSPGDLAPVFNAILQKARALCGVDRGTLLLYDGEYFRAVATQGLPAAVTAIFREPNRPAPGELRAQLLAGARYAHSADLAESEGYRSGAPSAKIVVDIGGTRSVLWVPLRKDGVLLGAISAGRTEVKPFSDKQIRLLENFAAQAVVAMENARLITETREALEHQTAVSDVLKVISRSTFDLRPVLDTLAETAARLCDASYGAIYRRDGNVYRIATAIAFSPEASEAARKFQAFMQHYPVAPDRGTITGRVALERRAVHVIDTACDPEYKLSEATTLGNLHTQLGVPMLRDGEPIGVIALARHRVEAFTDRQIELARTFADQAVIAMENARLLTETREALEQQTATAEVLRVINSSPGNLGPVFDALLEKATRLCDAVFGNLWTYDGEVARFAAVHGASPEFRTALMQAGPQKPEPGNSLMRLVQGEPLVHIADITAEGPYQSATRRRFAEGTGARTALWVPLRKDGALLGFFTIYRTDVRPFTDKQIALLQNFAEQAVIAMENGRLITETREALEQQTATAEVLGVINSSPGDLAPVFDAMLHKALRLCDGSSGTLQSYDGTHFHVLAVRGPSEFEEWGRQLGPLDPAPGTTLANLAQGERVVQVTDMAESEGYRTGASYRRAMVDIGGFRSNLTVALRRDEVLVGALHLYRKEARRFTDKQVALLQSFAAQAVIAMENARLITETREALEQQTATAEVLQVINSSPGDLAPVFDAMLEKAMRLCEAAFGMLHTYDGKAVRLVAKHGLPPRFAEFAENPVSQPGPGGATPRLIAGARFVHILDLKEEEAYRSGEPYSLALVDLGGARTLLAVPLRRDGNFFGQIAVYRQQARPYSEKQIGLLESFAAQAVIAMENARLLTETREALEQQTATADVLQVINSSPGNLVPVFDAILDKAHGLCGATFGSLQTYDGEFFRTVASRGLPDTFLELLREPFRPVPNSFEERLVRGDDLVHIPDVTPLGLLPDDPLSRTAVETAGLRTLLLLPLRKEGALVGYVASARSEVRPFTDKQIALLQSFAAQAVIAMENARLITETREALEQQTATAEVLGVINASPGDLGPVFEVMVERAAHLCEADEAAVRSFDGELLHLVTTHGTDPSALERLRGLGPTELEGLYAPFADGTAVVHYVDARDTNAYRTHPVGRQRIDARGIRSWLAVALRKEGTLLGIINVHRREVRPFTDKQIALLQNFAAQAVIAIENARLLDEIRQRQAELRVTFDNMGDGVVMFDGALHLAAWNRNFQELLDLPENLLAERPGFDEYIRYLTERGEFGASDPATEIARLRARLGDHYSFERTRPDGTVIEVRNNPMPDGGVVLIFSDITERKRSEEEISAARDAAETAYAELKAAQANLIQAEKMASLGQLTAGIAHEIKNPLNFVNNFASLSNELLDELKDEAEPALATLADNKRAEIDETLVMLSGNLEKIAEHGKRADNIVKSMLEHSRGVSGERREVDLNNLIEEALNLAYHGARAQNQDFNITLERDYAQGLKPIELAPQEITRVFLNLFGNGFYAANKRARANGDGSYHPVLAVVTCEVEDAVEVRVRDNGTGIAPEIRDKLFQPFFTTKPTGEGTGLGLSISYDIVTQQHGGTITVESEPGSFTEFTVRFPRH